MLRHIDYNGISELTKLTSLNLRNNLLSSLPFCLSLLPLEHLNIAQNLIISNYSYPYFALKQKNIRVHKSNKLSNVSPDENTIYSRILFIGDKNSSLFFYFFLKNFLYLFSFFL